MVKIGSATLNIKGDKLKKQDGVSFLAKLIEISKKKILDDFFYTSVLS